MDHFTGWPDDVFNRADLPGLGATEADLRRSLRSGRVRRVVRGSFVRADVPDSIELRARSIAKVVRPHHVVTDRSAAWLHGVDTYALGELDGSPEVETCALRDRHPTSVVGADGRTRDLRPEDVMTLHGVPVTTPLRTALDLGCVLRRPHAFAALCAFARVHGLRATDYAGLLGRYYRRRGCVQLKGLVPLVDPRLESQREALTLLAISDAGLPLPEPQAWIEIGGVPTYRLDFAYRGRRVCVEYDGVEAHAGREEKDAERRRWLRDHGWTVIVVRAGDLTGAALDRWIGELREALALGYSTRR